MNIERAVPDMELTSTPTVLDPAGSSPLLTMHLTIESVVHDVVPQTVDPTLAVADVAYEPKLIPATVTLDAPVIGAFSKLASETIGAS